jgi:hypothetical protein
MRDQIRETDAGAHQTGNGNAENAVQEDGKNLMRACGALSFANGWRCPTLTRTRTFIGVPEGPECAVSLIGRCNTYLETETWSNFVEEAVSPCGIHRGTDRGGLGTLETSRGLEGYRPIVRQAVILSFSII